MLKTLHELNLKGILYHIKVKHLNPFLRIYHAKYEVELRGTPIEQVPKFNYLDAEISAKRELKQEVRTQAMKAARISGLPLQHHMEK